MRCSSSRKPCFIRFVFGNRLFNLALVQRHYVVTHHLDIFFIGSDAQSANLGATAHAAKQANEVIRRTFIGVASPFILETAVHDLQ